jgi:CheY-like chemotaxis protein
MPRLGGVALARAVAAERPGIPVLLISGLAEEDALRPRGVPGVRFLAKPFTGPALLGELRAALDAPPASRGG